MELVQVPPNTKYVAEVCVLLTSLGVKRSEVAAGRRTCQFLETKRVHYKVLDFNRDMVVQHAQSTIDAMDKAIDKLYEADEIHYDRNDLESNPQVFVDGLYFGNDATLQAHEDDGDLGAILRRELCPRCQAKRAAGDDRCTACDASFKELLPGMMGIEQAFRRCNVTMEEAMALDEDSDGGERLAKHSQVKASPSELTAKKPRIVSVSLTIKGMEYTQITDAANAEIKTSVEDAIKTAIAKQTQLDVTAGHISLAYQNGFDKVVARISVPAMITASAVMAYLEYHLLYLKAALVENIKLVPNLESVTVQGESLAVTEVVVQRPKMAVAKRQPRRHTKIAAIVQDVQQVAPATKNQVSVSGEVQAAQPVTPQYSVPAPAAQTPVQLKAAYPAKLSGAVQAPASTSPAVVPSAYPVKSSNSAAAPAPTSPAAAQSPQPITFSGAVETSASASTTATQAAYTPGRRASAAEAYPVRVSSTASTQPQYPVRLSVSSTSPKTAAQTGYPVVVSGTNEDKLQKVAGYIASGGELGKATMTVEAAKSTCKTLPGCKGFTFQGADTHLPVEIYFKSIDDWHPGPWTSYIFQKAQGAEVGSSAGAPSVAKYALPPRMSSAGSTQLPSAVMMSPTAARTKSYSLQLPVKTLPPASVSPSGDTRKTVATPLTAVSPSDGRRKSAYEVSQQVSSASAVETSQTPASTISKPVPSASVVTHDSASAGSKQAVTAHDTGKTGRGVDKTVSTAPAEVNIQVFFSGWLLKKSSHPWRLRRFDWRFVVLQDFHIMWFDSAEKAREAVDNRGKAADNDDMGYINLKPGEIEIVPDLGNSTTFAIQAKGCSGWKPGALPKDKPNRVYTFDCSDCDHDRGAWIGALAKYNQMAELWRKRPRLVPDQAGSTTRSNGDRSDASPSGPAPHWGVVI